MLTKYIFFLGSKLKSTINYIIVIVSLFISKKPWRTVIYNPGDLIKERKVIFTNLGWETTEETKPEMHKCECKILIEEIA